MAARTETAEAPQYALEISRLFDAPPSLVFKLWTTPEHLARWWGPRNFSSTTEIFEFREGGRYRHLIHGPDGQTYAMSGIFQEIIEPKRIAFTFSWDEGDFLDLVETLVSVSIAAEGDRTRLIFRQEPFADIETRDSHIEGWSECLDKLGVYLESI